MAARPATPPQPQRGSCNREIAAALGKSMSTVKAQLSGVYRKLRIKNRLQLIMLFRS